MTDTTNVAEDSAVTPPAVYPLQAAEHRMREAKRLFTAAALACMKQGHRAAEEVGIALREVDYALNALREARREIEEERAAGATT